MHTNEEILARIHIIENELECIRRAIENRDDSGPDLLLGPKGPVSFDDSFTNSVFDVKCCWPTVARDGNVIFKEHANE